MSTINIQEAINLTGMSAFTVSNALNSENTDYSKFEVSNGYGQISSAGATVQKGITGHVSISLTIRSFSESSYQATTKTITNTVKSQSADELEAHMQSRDYSSWWYTLLGMGSNKSSDEYRKSTHSSATITENAIKDALEKNMSSNLEEFSVSGSFDIVGTSNIPTTVNLFIKTLTITTSDGNSIVVVSKETAAADNSGTIVPSSGTINIGPSLV